MENLYRNRYHLEPPRGLLNDPNGLSYYQGKYHVFHQWNRFGLDHSYKEWGLFTSRNLIDWEHQGSALLPDCENDISGVYSGSALVVGEELNVFFTGNNKLEGRRQSHQCQAISLDGQTFQKMQNAVKTPDLFTEHHRDPKVWFEKGGYHMVVGGQSHEGSGLVAYYQSEDCRSWHYQGIFFSAVELEQMAECPDYFELDDESVLLVCPQKRDLEKDEDISSYAGYYLGDLKGKKFKPRTSIQPLDEGFDFYAPQTFLDPKGRRLMWAWMSGMTAEQEKSCPTRDFGYLHCLTMPRELKMKNGKLFQSPLEEIFQQLMGRKRYVGHQLEISQVSLQSVIDIIWQEGPSDFEIDLFNKTVCLTYNGENLILSRKSWSKQGVESKTIQIKQLSALQIFIDSSTMEIFLNRGEKVLSLRYFLDNETHDTYFHSSQSMEITYSTIES